MVKLKLTYGATRNNTLFATLQDVGDEWLKLYYSEVYRDTYTNYNRKKKERKMNMVRQYLDKNLILGKSKPVSEKVVECNVLSPMFKSKEKAEDFLKQLSYKLERLRVPYVKYKPKTN